MEDTTPKTLLDAVYTELGYEKGALFEASKEPSQFSKVDWIEKGEWLTLTREVGAEKIFFVGNNPVVIFAQSNVNDPEKLRELFNNIWCMSRPRLLFLATPGELAVYDLANQPAKSQEDWQKLKPLEAAQSANEVAKKLKAFRREQLETGRLFEEYRFGDLKNRADKALIRDLKEVRKELIEEGLDGEKVKYAHALIGRSIFIRYLEDRGILIPEDFQDLASKKKEWKTILENKNPRTGINLSELNSLYARVLSDKDFTFALFEKLAKDFNGDMFPDIEQEKEIVTQKHLYLVQDLLFGDVGKQKNLFFYAYQFKIIPIELISSIYEEFYHPEASEEKNMIKSSEGAYYTSPALVEFLVNQVLTPERLKTTPRVLDPACGSGIFLVEAFRRIVRHRSLELGRRPNFKNLQVILREQIAGIEINPEAIRIAAFSLYLAMLHYLDPPSIREQIYERGNRLPNLVFKEGKQKKKSYNTLLAKNAFDSEYIENNPILQKSFLSNCFDIVIGNPPWGSPGHKKEDKEAREANKIAVGWCNKRKLPIGDQERSQAFIWRTLDALKQGGYAGLLVSTGILFKHHKNSVNFRRLWLSKNTLTDVFNFAHTRKVFFSGAISPFAAILFYKKEPQNTRVNYWISRKVSIVENLISAIFYKNDLKVLPYEINELEKYQTWKIFWWGSRFDKQLIEYLRRFKTLETFSKKGLFGRGYDESEGKYPSDWLKNYKKLPIAHFVRYGTIKDSHLESPPNKVNRRGLKEIYSGLRLLVKRGIEEKKGLYGKIIARLGKKDFCFTNDIHGIKLTCDEEWKYKIILGIIWSSLARYYFFLTTSNWGIWHHEIHLEDELMQLPICFPVSTSLKERIVTIVDKLQTSTPEEAEDIFQTKKRRNVLSKKEIAQLEKKLDEAIFELYELNDAEIDLIREMCEIGLPYYYSPGTSIGVKPVLTAGSLPEKTEMADYVKIFSQCWEAYIDTNTEFCWQVHQSDKTDSMIALEFLIQKKGEKAKQPEQLKSWNEVLKELEENLTQPFYSSRIYLEGMVRAVTNDYVIIIKRNEKRLWTRSMAREDAEATLFQAINRKSRGAEAANE